MSRIGLVVRAVLSDYFLLGASILGTLVLTPLIIHYLRPEGYSLWVIFASLLGYMGLIDLGLGPTTAVQVARFLALGRRQDLNEFVSTVVFLYLPLSLVVVVAGIALAPFIPTLFHISSELREAAPWAFAAACAGAAVGLPRGLLRGIIVGHQRTALANSLDAVFAFVTIGVIAIAVILGTGLLGAIVAGAATTVLHTLTGYVLVRRLFPSVRLVPQMPSAGLVATSLHLGIPILVVSIAGQVIFRTDSVVIGLFKGAEFVSSYAVAYALAWFGLNLVFKVSDSLLPVFSSLSAAGERNALRQAYLESSRLSVALAMCLTVGLIVFGKRAIGIWVGPKHFVGMTTLTILALVPTINAATHVGAILLIGLGRARSVARVNIPEALLNLVFSILLVQWIGVAGVALGTILGELATTFWYVPRLSIRELGLSSREFLVGVWLRPLMALPPAVAVAWWIESALGGLPAAMVLVAGAVTTTATYFGAYFFLSTEQERSLYLAAVRSLWGQRQATPAER